MSVCLRTALSPHLTGAESLISHLISLPPPHVHSPPTRYLRPSIERFPRGPQQEALARQAGFARAVHYPLAFGLMGCLVATKGS